SRRRNAKLYNDLLAGVEGLRLPVEAPGRKHVYHVYAVRLQPRDELLRALGAKGIHCGIHYPIPVHLQEAYRPLGLGRGTCPMAERCADEFISLPMFPELRPEQIEMVARELGNALRTIGA